VNDGEVAVLLGSTGKMGTGMNAQKRLAALHHFDCPWTPSSLGQRDGRILRQGNDLLKEIEGFNVSIFSYCTEASFDAGMWSCVEIKAQFIDELRAGNKGIREMEDCSLEAANAATMKALASGDPRVLEHVSVSQEVKELESAERGQARLKATMKSRLRDIAHAYESFPVRIAARENDLAMLGDGVDSRMHRNYADLQGVCWFKRDDAISAIEYAARSDVGNVGDIELGTYRGLPLFVTIAGYGVTVSIGESRLIVADVKSYKDLKWRGIFAKCEDATYHLESSARKLSAQMAGLPAEEDKARKALERPSPYTERLASAQARLSELDEELGAIGELPEGISENVSYKQAAAIVDSAWTEADALAEIDTVRCLCLSAYASELEQIKRKLVGAILRADEKTWPDSLAALVVQLEAVVVPSVDSYEEDYAALVAELGAQATRWAMHDVGTERVSANDDEPLTPEEEPTAPEEQAALPAQDEESSFPEIPSQPASRAEQLSLFGEAA